MDLNKKIYLDYIKAFQEIKLTKVCKDLGVDRTNLIKGLASTEATKRVKEEIERRLKEINKDTI